MLLGREATTMKQTETSTHKAELETFNQSSESITMHSDKHKALLVSFQL